jgi:hypothetical protein
MNLNNFQQDCYLQSDSLLSGHTGIKIECTTVQELDLCCLEFQKSLHAHSLNKHIRINLSHENGKRIACFRLNPAWLDSFTKDYDTLQLCKQLKLDIYNKPADLEKEILLAMLMSPVAFKFPSHAELFSAVEMRKNIVNAARKTILDFQTTDAERPSDYWTFDDNTGFTLLPGKPLITALKKATQPDESGKLYSFACYRATEYVILLGIAQELERINPTLFHIMQKQWEEEAIMSGRFHEVFLREYGSMEAPLPQKYYVPGDRLWFRNPDEHSSNVTGYEGSWVFYLGDGLFSNFWKSATHYTLTAKCLEIYHWRHATYLDPSGELKINEDIVEEHVRSSMQNPAEVEQIMEIMQRYREPQGVYESGGCIDATREYPRYVRPETTDMVISVT